jgi:hypothetical protein
LRIIVAALLATLLGASTAFGQLTEAQVKGTVRDADGNAVAQAPVVLRNEATGQVRSTATDDSGTYFLAGLQTGVYTVFVRVPGFKTYEAHNVKLDVGQTLALEVRLEVGDLQESVDVIADADRAPIVTDGRLSDTVGRRQISSLPLAQRDIFLLPKLSAGATAIPGAANSTKLSSSPVVTVNGNRYRGNNYVLDGAVNTNPNNTGEPALVPSVESVEEVQVQTSNFSSEYGRGNGAVVNLSTKSGTNEFHGRVWEYHRNAALNARNFFARERAPQVFNQFGANVGGPIFKGRTFFFGSYEGTRNATGNAYSFQVETPELRDYVLRTAPGGVAAQLLSLYPAPAPLPGAGGQRYADQRDLVTPEGTIPAIGRAAVTVRDSIRFDQYLVRVDHSFNNNLDKITGRWIAESQRDNGGTSSSAATLGRAARGSRGPFDGSFSNLNLGYIKVFDRAVNDARISFLNVDTERGNPDAVVPDVSITGITAPFGDVFRSGTRLRTYEFRDTLTLDRGRHSLRVGAEYRRIFKGLSIGPATAGAFFFTSLADFVTDRPFRQTLTVDPFTGQPTGFGRYFTIHEAGIFFQDDWKVSSRLNVSLGLRWDYFGDAKEREGRLSSIIFGEGDSFEERLRNASVGRVDRLYTPEKTNFSPRVGLAYDPAGDGKTVLRAGFSLAYQPHHGQSIAGARALPPDAIQGVIQPASGIGTQILYGIPVPYNPEFARGLNPFGGVNSLPGEPPIRTTGFVVNPDIKTQYSESWFFNVQRELFGSWIADVGYIGTQGINLERIDDVNRKRGDLLDGREDRINPNFTTLLFVTNGVTSSFNAMTAELRGNVRTLTIRANYRWSKWLDTASDTSTGQFADNSEPGKGAQDAACLGCERARSLFDIPHRFTAAVTWDPDGAGDGWVRAITENWQISTIVTAQSGRPFSVWNGAAFRTGGDYNADAGGGAVGGGFYDRPDAPAPGTYDDSWDRQDFLSGLFDPSIFPRPAPGQNGTLGRNTFRGPRYTTVDLAVARSFVIAGEREIQLRLEAFNVLNTVNLYLPNSDLSLALQPDGTFSKSSAFGKSTQAFEPRVLQAAIKFSF